MIRESDDFKEANYTEFLKQVRRETNLAKTMLTTPVDRIKSTIQIMPFGKHKGKSFIKILQEDEQYMVWLYTKNIVKFDKETEVLIKRKIKR